MAIVSRVFFIEENGGIRSIPWQRYERLYFGDTSAAFPELAGKAVKGIHVVVEDRLPVSIVEINYFLTYFNDKGAIDQEKKREAQLLLARTRRDDVPAQQNDTVIDINPELSEKRYCREFRWTPTEKEADRLERQIEKILGIREQ
jgi:hypothetical protein